MDFVLQKQDHVIAISLLLFLFNNIAQKSLQVSRYGLSPFQGRLLIKVMDNLLHLTNHILMVVFCFQVSAVTNKTSVNAIEDFEHIALCNHMPYLGADSQEWDYHIEHVFYFPLKGVQKVF